MRRTLQVALVSLVLVAVSGTAAVARSGEPSGGDAPAVPEIEVLDRGASPRTDLRITVPVGATETLRMRTLARISQTVGGQTRSGSTPNITFTIDASVDAVDESGNLTVSYTYASIDVSESGPAAVVEATRESLEPLLGVTGTMVVTDKGALLSSEVPVPSGLDAQAEQLFDQLQSQATALTVPYPDGKVGRGARWRASSEVELSGIEFEQQATYTVERTRGGRTTLSVEIVQRAPRQEFTPPGTDEELLLVSSRGTGSGESIVAPSEAVMPVGGGSDVRTRQRLEVDGDAVSQTTSTSIFLNEDR